MTPQQTYILGAGAIGSLWAVALQQAGYLSRLISRQKQTSEATQSNHQPQCDHHSAQIDKVPITIETPYKPDNENHKVAQSIPAVSTKQIQNIHFLIVCVKSYQLETALKSIAHAIESHSTVLLLQNGMGNSDIAQQCLPKCQLLLGTTTHGAYKNQHGHVIHVGHGTTHIGPDAATTLLKGVPQWIAQLQSALPEVIWELNIQDTLWKKLCVSAIINPLTALHQCKNGDILTKPEYRDQIALLAKELQPVIHEYCPQLDDWNIIQAVHQIATLTEHNHSSMLQDVRQNKPTEIESITGYLLQCAKHIDVSMPTHQSLYQFIHNC